MQRNFGQLRSKPVKFGQLDGHTWRRSWPSIFRWGLRGIWRRDFRRAEVLINHDVFFGHEQPAGQSQLECPQPAVKGAIAHFIFASEVLAGFGAPQ